MNNVLSDLISRSLGLLCCNGHHSLSYPNQTVCCSERLSWADWLKNFNYLVINKDEIYLPKHYEFFGDKKPSFPPFSQVRESTIEINILDVKGLGSSKSNLADFSDLKEMAKKQCPELLNHSVEELLSWPELRFNGSVYSDYISVYSWDAQPYLIQRGGSHHFAAAQYRCAELNQDHFITLPLREVSLNLASIKALLNKVSLFYIPTPEIAQRLTHVLNIFNITHTEVISPYMNRDQGIGAVFVVPRCYFTYRCMIHLLRRTFEDVGETLLLQAARPYHSLIPDT